MKLMECVLLKKILIYFVCTTLLHLSIGIAGGTGPDMNNQILEKATFAGGCFWCVQGPFDKLEGVASTNVGYTGGQKKGPTYKEVCSGSTGHAEAIEILFDSSKITYSELLDVLWKNIDPTTPGWQFADVGTQYRTAIFYHNEEQKRLAEESKDVMDKSGKYDGPIVTEIVPASIFYKAEEYHQKYYEKCPIRYKMYKSGPGREQYIKKMWGEER